MGSNSVCISVIWTRGVIGDMVSFYNFLEVYHTFFIYLILYLVARDYVEGMWLMLQQPHPEDFVLATGETHPVREFVEKAFGEVDMQIKYV